MFVTSVRRHAGALVRATFVDRCDVAGMRVNIPGGRTIRWSVIAGNMRIHRLIDEVVRAGDTVIDVGANIGYNTVYLARAVGPAGRVIAIEPAIDNLDVLQRQCARNRLQNVAIHDVAAGRAAEIRDLFLRGAVSAVNSLFPDGCYGPVTGVTAVRVLPLDDLVEGNVDVVKIDVEGGELDVLGGMTRLLQSSRIRLIVEWHPALQVAAGYEADALPGWLLAQGFSLQVVWHTGRDTLSVDPIKSVSTRLRRRQRSVELFAQR